MQKLTISEVFRRSSLENSEKERIKTPLMISYMLWSWDQRMLVFSKESVKQKD